MPQNILITGAGGMLGKDMAEVLAIDKKYKVFGTIRKTGSRKSRVTYIKADLMNKKDLKKILSKSQPDIIIHCAANVSLDACEENKKETDLLHIKATEILSSYKKNNTKFIYISTDSVFNGKTGNYTELDEPNPLNYYAYTKLRGEEAAIANNKNSLIVRTCIYGFHEPVGNSLVEWAIHNLESKNSIYGFTDIFFNPVYTKQLARTIKDILEDKRGLTGILNIGSTKSLSKYDFLKSIASQFKFKKLLIRPASIKNSTLKTPRPNNTTLSVAKLNKLLNNKTLKISDGIAELRKDYQDTLTKSV